MKKKHQKKKKYEFIDHTADIGLRVYGKNLSELFQHAALGLIEILVDADEIHEREKVILKARAEGIEDLFVSWLEEILYKVQVQHILLKSFKIQKLRDTQIIAHAKGEEYNPKRHHLKTEVKAVTYHNLKVEKSNSGWHAEVIFDI